MSLNRTLAGLIDTSGDVKSTSLDNAASLTVYATKEDLPSSGMSSGDQAYVTGNSRFYISNGSGWYNVALINATPSLSIDPTGTIVLSVTGETTTITLTATDSDNAVAGLTYSVDSDGSFGGLATISQDSSVFTITPLSEDSATTATSTLTFKASDGISFGSASRALSLTFRAANSNYTTLLLKNEETSDNQVDASTNARTITEGGNITSTAFTPYHPGGYSTYFDGSGPSTGDYLALPASSTLAHGTGSFTIEFWLYASPNVWDGNIYDTRTGGTPGTGFAVSITSGVIGFYSEVQPSGQLLQSSALSTNTWYHVAIVRDGSSMALYINGTSVDTATNSSSFTNTTGTIGARYSRDQQYYLGYLQDFRVLKGTALYTSDFTPPTERLTAITNTSLLTCHLPYIADGSSNDHAITAANPQTKRFGPYTYYSYNKTDYGGSIFNDGIGDYMTTPADTTNLTMAGDFTIDFWYYPTAAKTNGYVYGKYNNNSDGWTIFITPNWSSGNFGYLTFYYGNYGSNESATSLRSNPITLNAWHYCRITRESGVFYMSVNGKVGTRSNYGANGLSWSDTRTFNANTTIGITGQVGYTLGEAYLADLRVINGTALTTSDFTPPTAPVSAVTNTVLLTCTNKNSIWDAAGANEVITVGGTAAASNTQRKFTTSSAIAYDGNSDYLQIPANDFFNFGTDDFTMETYVYAVATGNSYPAFMSSVTGWSSGANGHRFDNTGYANKFAFYVNGFGGRSGGNPFMHTTNTFSHDTWYHYAVTRSGNTFKMFINGVLEDTQTSTGSLNIALGGFRSGWSFDGANGYFNGYVQDMRITRGLARYTSNFTPPTTEFVG